MPRRISAYNRAISPQRPGMSLSYAQWFRIGWSLLLVYWMWSSRNVKTTMRDEGRLAQLLKYWLPLAIACVLLGPDPWFDTTPLLQRRFIPDNTGVAVASLLAAYAGMALACWSRAILGRNWSSVVQLKQDHVLIEHGPYRYVRHPIYSGLLLALLATATMLGQWRGLLALAIVFVSFWRKLRLEERWLGERFGPRYQAYRQRTRALIPGLL